MEHGDEDSCGVNPPDVELLGQRAGELQLRWGFRRPLSRASRTACPPAADLSCIHTHNTGNVFRLPDVCQSDRWKQAPQRDLRRGWRSDGAVALGRVSTWWGGSRPHGEERGHTGCQLPTLTLGFVSRTAKNKYVCRLSCAICGVLLRQPKLTGHIWKAFLHQRTLGTWQGNLLRVSFSAERLTWECSCSAWHRRSVLGLQASRPGWSEFPESLSLAVKFLKKGSIVGNYLYVTGVSRFCETKINTEISCKLEAKVDIKL